VCVCVRTGHDVLLRYCWAGVHEIRTASDDDGLILQRAELQHLGTYISLQSLAPLVALFSVCVVMMHVGLQSMWDSRVVC
jgi:hypothetical protein